MATRTASCRMDASIAVRTDEGFLDAPVNPTRVGVFRYLDSETGGIIHELRPLEEVSRADSLSSLDYKTFTNDHPPKNIDAETNARYDSGIVKPGHKMAADGIHTETRVLVKDSRAIKAIEGGKREVSCGYTCDIDNTPGTWQGQRYDRIQRNIKYNHLALVAKGRAGSGARIHTDADDSPQARFDAYEVPDDWAPEQITKDTKPKEVQKRMATIRIDNRDFTVDEAVEIAYSNKAKADEAALVAAQAKADKAEADKAAIQAKYDEAQDKIKSLESVNIEARVDAVLELRDKARPILGKDYVFAGKSEAQIKQDVLAKARPALKLDGLSPAYIDARFDAVIEDQQQAPGRTVLDAYDSAPVARADYDFSAPFDPQPVF